MSKTNNYFVIGGQYETVCYGGAPTLIGAKRLANKHTEYWDNWIGFVTPRIYAAEDTEIVIAHSMVTHAEGSRIIVPKYGAEPVA